MPTLRERIEGALWGLLIGDAVGVPYEFKLPQALPPLDQLELVPPKGFPRSHHGVPPGTWSDDGAQALCLLASLLTQGRMDLDDLGRRLTNWHELGYLTPDGVVFDVGIQTHRALSRLREGTPAAEAGPAQELDNGNGSLMRVLPLALWHTGDDATLVRDARTQSLVTHGHLRSQLACALYVLWVRRLLEEVERPWEAAVATLRRMFPEGTSERAELEQHLQPDLLEQGRGSGYVADSLRSSRWAFSQGPYETAIKSAISLGVDTDTTAAIAGGAAGARDGLSAIPARWREGLRGEEEFRPLLEALLRHRGL